MKQQLSPQEAKSELLSAAARLAQAFANPQRLQILGLLGHATYTIEELADRTEQSMALTSAHVKVLKTAGLVVSEKQGRHQHCRLASGSVTSTLTRLRALSEELMPDVREVTRQFFQDPESTSALNVRTLKSRLKGGPLRLIDLRPAKEFKAGRIPGAESLPFSELRKRPKLKADHREVLAYCRGPYCFRAVSGAELLREQGIAAKRLALSVPEWKAAGYRLEY